MNFNIGDKVIINPKYNFLKWYSTQIYCIISLDKNIAQVDRNLYNFDNSVINVEYLLLLKDERKKKLNKLESFNFSD